MGVLDNIQIFISYRRKGGAALAGRISDRLSPKYRVFFDMETMHSGRFNKQIIQAVEQCDDIILILPPDALDRCVNEDDWVRREIALGLQHGKNIIPVMMEGFEYPETLPPEISDIRNMESVKDNAEYFDSVIDRIESFLHCKRTFKEPDPFTVGSIVGDNYQITCELGKGGSAVVYLAQDIKMDMMVAIKRIRKENFLNFASAKENILREFHIQKMCKHNGIANVRGFFEYNDEFAIVMDYIPGTALDQLLRAEGQIKESDVLQWGIQICTTLQYLHSMEKPLYLCDIKPANIIIQDSGEAVLIDFGVSQQDTPVSLADTTVLGTNGYATPELYSRNVDARTDIYSLEQTLHHALTGHSPLDPPYDTLPVRHFRPELSKLTEQIIDKCISRNPDNRYPSAADLQADLNVALVKLSKKPWYRRILHKTAK